MTTLTFTPAAASSPGTPDISHRALTIVNSAEEVSDLVSGHNDPAVASAVLDYGHAVDLAQPLVHHAGAADVGKARGVLVALALGLGAAHIQAGEGDHEVKDGELCLGLVEIFPHQVQGLVGLKAVPSHLGGLQERSVGG